MKRKKESISILLNKFCDETAQLSMDELRELYFLLGSKEEEERISVWMQQRWNENPEGFDEINYERIYKRVQQQLEAGNNRRHRFVSFIQRAAAILLFPLLGLSGYLLVKNIIDSRPVRTEIIVNIPAEQEYMTEPGMRSKVTLSDSTVVWLNAASRLIVAKGYGEAQRRVTLVGEAYFEVAKDEHKLFTVNTSELDIKVHGTTFNLSAYPNELTKAILVEGSIEAITKNENKKMFLKPDQMLKIQNQNQIDVESNVNTELYTSWTNGMLVFYKTPMEEVARTLERWYNVNIELNDKLLKTYHFTGTFDNRSLEQVMSYISLSSSVDYKIDIENDHVTIYSKKKI
jgi:ferric-dicitrate binding protein FerR (iron transport regulator)